MNNIEIYLTKNDNVNSDLKIAYFAKEFCKDLNFEPKIKRIEGEKPRLENLPEVFFSLSHSKDFWACAFSNFECGLDLQYKKDLDYLDFAKKFFTDSEIQFLSQKNNEDVQDAFYKIWTAKESFSKFLGVNMLKSSPKNFSVAKGEGIVLKTPERSLKFLHIKTGYEACVCAKEIDGIKIFYR